ncbi:MAG TPA: hypothetical protein DHV15_11225 [Treponema sp.]|uniref:Uncharacterized protein n=1 Tax=Treponema denticola (strain ATCC 35405 / DSM 14222 / CIP 103919 / JCM 8153 / KCTC 15104) TaxID=243275 RepID=Q73N66_TREDE|nr:hypothetical protein TDE_1289 [Treponema denticola ATCC 35405]HCY96058.1 hypothetical protein [Treponema sp.]
MKFYVNFFGGKYEKLTKENLFIRNSGNMCVFIYFLFFG